MSTYELSGKFVSDGAIAIRGGRTFVAFKPPGGQRNVLYEVQIVSGAASLIPHGMTPGVYYKDGNCSLSFNDTTGELLMLNFCSPDPATGGAARAVLWTTGIIIAGANGTADMLARTQIANLIAKLHQV